MSSVISKILSVFSVSCLSISAFGQDSISYSNNSSLSPLRFENFTELYKLSIDANFFSEDDGSFEFKTNLLGIKQIVKPQKVLYYESKNSINTRNNKILGSFNIGVDLELNDNANKVMSYVPSFSVMLPNRSNPQFDKNFLRNDIGNKLSINQEFDQINTVLDAFRKEFKNSEEIKLEKAKNESDSIKGVLIAKLNIETKLYESINTEIPNGKLLAELYKNRIQELNEKLEHQIKVVDNSITKSKEKLKLSIVQIKVDEMKQFLWANYKLDIVDSILNYIPNDYVKKPEGSQLLSYSDYDEVLNKQNLLEYDYNPKNEKTRNHLASIMIEIVLNKYFQKYLDPPTYRKQYISEVTNLYLRRITAITKIELPIKKNLKGINWESQITVGLNSKKVDKNPADFYLLNKLELSDTSSTENKSITTRLENKVTIGISKILLSRSQTNDDKIVYKDPLIEMRWQLEWTRIGKGLILNDDIQEDKDRFFIGVITNFRLAKDVWFPLTFKYKFGKEGKNSFQPGIGFAWNMTTDRKLTLAKK